MYDMLNMASFPPLFIIYWQAGEVFKSVRKKMQILTKPRKYHVNEQDVYDLITKKLY